MGLARIASRGRREAFNNNWHGLLYYYGYGRSIHPRPKPMLSHHSSTHPQCHLVLVESEHAEPVMQGRPEAVEDLEASQPLGKEHLQRRRGGQSPQSP